MGNPEELHPRTCPWKAPGSFGRFCSPCEGANFDGTKFSSKKIGPWSETCLRTCWFEYITFANYLYCEWSFKRIIPTTKNNIYVCYYIVCGLRLRSHHDSAWQFRHVKVCTQTSCWVEVGYALQVHLRVVSTFRGPPYVFRGFRLPFSFAGPFPCQLIVSLTSSPVFPSDYQVIPPFSSLAFVFPFTPSSFGAFTTLGNVAMRIFDWKKRPRRAPTPQGMDDLQKLVAEMDAAMTQNELQ